MTKIPETGCLSVNINQQCPGHTQLQQGSTNLLLGKTSNKIKVSWLSFLSLSAPMNKCVTVCHSPEIDKMADGRNLTQDFSIQLQHHEIMNSSSAVRFVRSWDKEESEPPPSIEPEVFKFRSNATKLSYSTDFRISQAHARFVFCKCTLLQSAMSRLSCSQTE